MYDFTAHSRRSETQTVKPVEVILLEGILTLHIPEVLDRLNMKVRTQRGTPHQNAQLIALCSAHVRCLALVQRFAPVWNVAARLNVANAVLQ